MRAFMETIRPHVLNELSAAENAERTGEFSAAFRHLERAHVLGQYSTLLHVQIHWKMFVWGWRSKRYGECLGQLLRIIGAASLTVFGFIPVGNTGGSNVHLFRTMPIPDDLKSILDSTQSVGRKKS